MKRTKPPRRVRSADWRRSRLATVLCLAVFLPLVAASPALALSGYATDQPPVNAQYPDVTTKGSEAGGGGELTSLSKLMTSRHRRARTPKAAARQRIVERRIARRATGALASAAGLAPSQSTSLILLLGAVGVVSIGGVLRWRRGLSPV